MTIAPQRCLFAVVFAIGLVTAVAAADPAWRPVLQLATEDAGVISVSPDGRRAVTAASAGGGSVDVWNLEQSYLLTTIANCAEPQLVWDGAVIAADGGYDADRPTHTRAFLVAEDQFGLPVRLDSASGLLEVQLATLIVAAGAGDAHEEIHSAWSVRGRRVAFLLEAPSAVEERVDYLVVCIDFAAAIPKVSATIRVAEGAESFLGGPLAVREVVMDATGRYVAVLKREGVDLFDFASGARLGGYSHAVGHGHFARSFRLLSGSPQALTYGEIDDSGEEVLALIDFRAGAATKPVVIPIETAEELDFFAIRGIAPDDSRVYLSAAHPVPWSLRLQTLELATGEVVEDRDLSAPPLAITMEFGLSADGSVLVGQPPPGTDRLRVLELPSGKLLPPVAAGITPLQLMGLDPTGRHLRIGITGPDGLPAQHLIDLGDLTSRPDPYYRGYGFYEDDEDRLVWTPLDRPEDEPVLIAEKSFWLQREDGWQHLDAGRRYTAFIHGRELTLAHGDSGTVYRLTRTGDGVVRSASIDPEAGVAILLDPAGKAEVYSLDPERPVDLSPTAIERAVTKAGWANHSENTQARAHVDVLERHGVILFAGALVCVVVDRAGEQEPRRVLGLDKVLVTPDEGLAVCTDYSGIAVYALGAPITYEGDDRPSLDTIVEDEPRLTIPGHIGPVLSADGKRLFTHTRGGALAIWELPACRLLATLAVDAAAQPFALLPDGNWAGPRRLEHFIGMARAGQIVEPLAWDAERNRPDTVLAALGYAEPTQVDALRQVRERRLARLAEAGVASQPGGPMIALASPPPTATDALTMPLFLRFKKGTTPVSTQVYVDGKGVWPAAGRAFTAEERDDGEATVDVPLTPGNHRISITAWDATGRQADPLGFTTIARAEAGPARTYFLGIGISAYPDAAHRLRYAAKDVTDLRDGLRRRLGDSLVDHLLLDDAATREGVLASRAFLEQATAQDRVIVHITGHGLLADKAYCFATYDCDFDNPAETGLPYAELESLLDGLASAHVLVLIDSCHSGELEGPVLARADGTARGVTVRGFTPDAAPADIERIFLRTNDIFTELRNSTGATIIAAASGAEFAYELGELKNGVFTYALMHGLLDGYADADQDGQVRADELRTYLLTTVPAMTGGRQRPAIKREVVSGLDLPVLPNPVVTWHSDPLVPDDADEGFETIVGWTLKPDDTVLVEWGEYFEKTNGPWMTIDLKARTAGVLTTPQVTVRRDDLAQFADKEANIFIDRITATGDGRWYVAQRVNAASEQVVVVDTAADPWAPVVHDFGLPRAAFADWVAHPNGKWIRIATANFILDFDPSTRTVVAAHRLPWTPDGEWDKDPELMPPEASMTLSPGGRYAVNFHWTAPVVFDPNAPYVPLDEQPATVRIVDLASGEETGRITGADAYAVATPDGLVEEVNHLFDMKPREADSTEAPPRIINHRAEVVDTHIPGFEVFREAPDEPPPEGLRGEVKIFRGVLIHCLEVRGPADQSPRRWQLLDTDTRQSIGWFQAPWHHSFFQGPGRDIVVLGTTPMRLLQIHPPPVPAPRP